MTPKRDIRDAARARLHSRARILATYSFGAGDPVEIGVRLLSEDRTVGPVTGFNDAAQFHEAAPEMIFLLSEVTPVRGAVVEISADERYRVDHLFPPDGLTIKAQVVRL